MRDYSRETFLGRMTDLDKVSNDLDLIRQTLAAMKYGGPDASFGLQSGTSFKKEFAQDINAAIQNLSDAISTINKYWREA